MSLCQFYLRGNCRYGNRCRMVHSNPNEPNVYNQIVPPPRPRHTNRPPFNSNYNYVAPSSIANRNHTVENRTASGSQKSKRPPALHWITGNFENRMKAFDIIEQLQKEAIVWLKSSNLWRFTSRSIFPGGRPLDGWADQSFEEVKWIYRDMKNQNQEHVYKKAYNDYWESTERQLLALSKLEIDMLNALKDRIDECVASAYKPSRTLSTDIEMNDVNDNLTLNFLPQTQSAHYTPDDQLLENERAAFESDTFELGQIPAHAPSIQFS